MKAVPLKSFVHSSLINIPVIGTVQRHAALISHLTYPSTAKGVTNEPGIRFGLWLAQLNFSGQVIEVSDWRPQGKQTCSSLIARALAKPES